MTPNQPYKTCPYCGQNCVISTKACRVCNYLFPIPPPEVYHSPLPITHVNTKRYLGWRFAALGCLLFIAAAPLLLWLLMALLGGHFP